MSECALERLTFPISRSRMEVTIIVFLKFRFILKAHNHLIDQNLKMSMYITNRTYIIPIET